MAEGKFKGLEVGSKKNSLVHIPSFIPFFVGKIGHRGGYVEAKNVLNLPFHILVHDTLETAQYLEQETARREKPSATVIIEHVPEARLLEAAIAKEPANALWVNLDMAAKEGLTLPTLIGIMKEHRRSVRKLLPVSAVPSSYVFEKEDVRMIGDISTRQFKDDTIGNLRIIANIDS